MDESELEQNKVREAFQRLEGRVPEPAERLPMDALKAVTSHALSVAGPLDAELLRDGLLQVGEAHSNVAWFEAQLISRCRRAGMRWEQIGEALGYKHPRQQAQTRFRRLCDQFPHIGILPEDSADGRGRPEVTL